MSAADRRPDQPESIPCERVDRVGEYFKRLFERSLEFEFATQFRVDLDKVEGTHGESVPAGKSPPEPGSADEDPGGATGEAPAAEDCG